jgi:hypothetical protein
MKCLQTARSNSAGGAACDAPSIATSTRVDEYMSIEIAATAAGRRI